VPNGGGSTFLWKSGESVPVLLSNGKPLSLSPDGKWIVSKTADDFMIVPTGPGQTRSIQNPLIEVYDVWGQWLPDGKNIVFSGREKNQPSRFYLQSLAGGQPKIISKESIRVHAQTGHVISPDGKKIAAMGSDGRCAIYPMDGGPRQIVPGMEPDEEVFQWDSDPNFILTFQTNKIPSKVFRHNIVTGKKELLQELKPPDTSGVSLIEAVRFTPDRKFYAYSYDRSLSTLYLVDGLK
jgi:Tol biopolymer transport system component